MFFVGSVAQIRPSFAAECIQVNCIVRAFQESLLNYRNRWFTDEAPHKVMDKFRSNLRQISDNMKRRNRQLETPYDYLLPEKICMRFDV